MINRDELLALHDELCGKAKQTMMAKNQDYSGASDDPFANFRGSLNFSVEPEIGIMMRIGDKFKRIESFIKKGTLAVKTESCEDALEDSINYVILLAGMLRERRETLANLVSDFEDMAMEHPIAIKETVGLGESDAEPGTLKRIEVSEGLPTDLGNMVRPTKKKKHRPVGSRK